MNYGIAEGGVEDILRLTKTSASAYPIMYHHTIHWKYSMSTHVKIEEIDMQSRKEVTEVAMNGII
jgi:hypothetical protein